jgi:alcohol dehydrogenase class IV
MAYLLPWRRPEIINTNEIPGLLKRLGVSSVLLVTDKGIAGMGLHNNLVNILKSNALNCVIYDKTVPNPTIENIERALALYRENNCGAIIAFGGGSPMDCAKGVGARVARPNKPIRKMRGQLKVLLKMPPFIAVPTTSGTGSETTLAAVVVDEKTHEKYAINDPALIPHYAVLDWTLTKGLPKAITAATGMDALTHAVEAYIGGSNTAQTRKDALSAAKLIFENLFNAYTDGNNQTARENTQKAAYLAGAAFTRAYVGNVHAAAHQLGGFYSTPHGKANAVILPYVLDAYGASVYDRLAEMADAAGAAKAGSNKEKAEAFIAAIRHMNKVMGIPEKITELKRSDIPELTRRALKEANPLYPVPVIFDTAKMEAIYYSILEG